MNGTAQRVAGVLDSAAPVAYTLGPVKVFAGADSGKPYDVLYAEVVSPDAVRLHGELCELPHTKTHAAYVPHATIAYVRAGTGAGYAAAFGAVGASGVARRVTFSTAAKEETVIPLTGSVAKACDPAPAMSTLTGSGGGFLVGPPRKRVRKKLVARLLRQALSKPAP